MLNFLKVSTEVNVMIFLVHLRLGWELLSSLYLICLQPRSLIMWNPRLISEDVGVGVNVRQLKRYFLRYILRSLYTSNELVPYFLSSFNSWEAQYMNKVNSSQLNLHLRQSIGHRISSLEPFSPVLLAIECCSSWPFVTWAIVSSSPSSHFQLSVASLPKKKKRIMTVPCQLYLPQP